MTYLASSSSSFPSKVNSVNLSLSQTRHSGGHISPQSPAQLWVQGKIFLQGSSHLGRLHGSPHFFVQVLCSQLHWHNSFKHKKYIVKNSNTQVKLQFTVHGIQGSQHLCRHLLCEQEYSHFCVHGGQERPQLTLQMCPQTRERPHFSAHARWTRPLKHSPQVPLQRCSQSSVAPHGSRQVTRWDWIWPSVGTPFTTPWKLEKWIHDWFKNIPLHLI